MRVDSGVIGGSEITPLYDPMIAKLIVWDADRERATRRMARALEEFELEGVKTLIPFHKAIMASEQWAKAQTCRDLIEDKQWLKELATPAPSPPDDEGETVARDYVVEVAGKRFEVTVHGEPPVSNGVAPAAPRRPRRAASARPGVAAVAATSSRRRCRATCSRCWWSRVRTSRRGRSCASSKR